ncbi:hypothetical protein VN12_00085 [Pirellula sp. SH-Sr6A]|uniref:hypothetical protein n=1 Tax=Pirellula sp. SH-Sr6A TaxID=1632865 RepID=UPI00078BE6CF|nr:hypothetical protein [Pirellula sp. SH-Sr6A]AMV30479.1 hypothetical protein VN12_00085 [Pirellula sp. SH-Sr6A]
MLKRVDPKLPWVKIESATVEQVSVFEALDVLKAASPSLDRHKLAIDEVRLCIIDLYERELPLTRKSHNAPKMRRSCRKHFGGWRKTVESLGLGSELRRMWTPQKVIEAILRRRAEGHDLPATRYEDYGLFAAAKNRFGSFNKAGGRCRHRCGGA